MIWLKILTLLCLSLGTWRSVQAMGRPVRFEGRRYYRQPYGTYRRWYGGKTKRPEEIGL